MHQPAVVRGIQRRRHRGEIGCRALLRQPAVPADLVFKPLDAAAIEQLLTRAETIEGKKLPLDGDARASLIRMADGDGRAALTLAEEVWRAARGSETFDAAALQDIVQRRAPIYDKSQDGHYNLISALHKSVRGSDPDAALYYLCRMLDAGEDPLYLARRIVRMAIEDIGLADPQALVVANAAKDAYDFLGSPEGELAIAQAVIYVATAPKSNAAYAAYGAAMRTAREAGSLLPPKHILNAPTRLMKTEGYGAGYDYDHDAPEAFSGQNYFPEALGRRHFYNPPERGFEREIRKGTRGDGRGFLCILVEHPPVQRPPGRSRFRSRAGPGANAVLFWEVPLRSEGDTSARVDHTDLEGGVGLELGLHQVEGPSTKKPPRPETFVGPAASPISSGAGVTPVASLFRPAGGGSS